MYILDQINFSIMNVWRGSSRWVGCQWVACPEQPLFLDRKTVLGISKKKEGGYVAVPSFSTWEIPWTEYGKGKMKQQIRSLYMLLAWHLRWGGYKLLPLHMTQSLKLDLCRSTIGTRPIPTSSFRASCFPHCATRSAHPVLWLGHFNGFRDTKTTKP